MIDADAYCRAIEAYLCRKNDGHLIRIAGPAFDLVRGWAANGVPLKVACAGIDRTFERYYRKGPRRRPLQLQFCEADVLDTFDDWRRAVGIHANEGAGADVEAEGETPAAARRRGSLAAHLEQALVKITMLRGSDRLGPVLGDALAQVAERLDPLHAESKKARGESRDAIVARLAELDDELLAAARRATAEGTVAEMEAEAEAELAPFRGRMAPEALARARAVALTRTLRAYWGLPQVRYE